MIADQVDVLNAQYAPHSVSFNLAGTTRTINSAWADDSDELAYKRELRRGDYSTLNIYLLRVRCSPLLHVRAEREKEKEEEESKTNS